MPEIVQGISRAQHGAWIELRKDALLKNLETARRRNADPRNKEMNEALNELDKMLRDQEGLRDETFRNEMYEAVKKKA